MALSWPLHDVQATRTIERQAQSQLPPHTLMQRAGLATAQLALALAPHAQRIWIACGPGNNGGDGIEAAIHLHQWGKQVCVTCTAPPETWPADAQTSWQRAQSAGIRLETTAPPSFDMGIDALLGIGCHHAPNGVMAQWLERLQNSEALVLQVDTPSGLLCDSGQWLGKAKTLATPGPRHTLSLLTLKLGLFTAEGRDAAGDVWFNGLGVDTHHIAPTAWLQTHVPAPASRQHNSHKGTYGDVIVIGGAPGMAGAAVLASLAALHAGAGRVYAGLHDEATHAAVTAAHPTLMVRRVDSLHFENATVVCGCGGGDTVCADLPRVLSTAAQLVLDADALNAIANDPALMLLLQQRGKRQRPTVLTPHPLEAARLLGCTTTEVQSQRLKAAQALAEQCASVVILKGSGSVIAQAQHTPVINHSGNGLLATAGTGDVLAGWTGALLAQGYDAFTAACIATHRHGALAHAWPAAGPALTASGLIARITSGH